MGCIYHNYSGKCTISEEDWEMAGSKDGYCVVDDDPDPACSCDTYESDYYCSECGVDLNIKECECNE